MDDIIVDIMPTNDTSIGFKNIWYPRGFEYAQNLTLADGNTIRVLTAPYAKLVPKQAEIQQLSIDVDNLFKENLLLENGLKIEIDSGENRPVNFEGPNKELNRYFSNF